MKTIKIAHLYYDLMNLYGENGNVRFLQSRLERQGFKVQIHFLTIDDKIDFNSYDIYYIGTGSEKNEKIVLEDILKYKKEIKAAFLKNKFFLITGNSLNFFGTKIQENDKETKALDIFPYISTIEDFRIVGEQRYLDRNGKEIIGFNNRNCITDIKENHLFTKIMGCGCNPNSQKEGIHEKNFYGTYLLGPLLVRNPHFCDKLVKELCRTYEVPFKEPDRDDVSYIAYERYLNNFPKKS